MPPDNRAPTTTAARSCILCDSPSVVRLDSKRGSHTQQAFQLYRCDLCGFGFAMPRVSDEAMREQYETDYRALHPELLSKDGRDVGGGGGNRRGLEDSTDIAKFDQKLDRFAELLRGSGRRIADIGCGGGFFLGHAKKRGWDVQGVELSPTAAEAARRNWNIPVISAPLSESGLPAGSFDVVHTKHILEHLQDVRADIREMHRILKPGGLLYVECPNEFNPLQRVATCWMVRDRWWFSPPGHINYFNFSSLETMLRNEGFEPLTRDTTFPVEVFLLLGVNYVRRPSLGRRVVHPVVSAVDSLDRLPVLGAAKRSVRRFAARLQIGREIRVIARKSMPY